MEFDGVDSRGDRRWLRLGRYSAWTCGTSLLLGFVVLMLAEAGVTAPLSPGREDMVAYFGYIEGKGPQLQVVSALVLVAFLTLGPMGMAVRHCLGKGPGVDLMGVAFAGGMVLGVTAAVVEIGALHVLFQFLAENPVDELDRLMLVVRYGWQPLILLLVATAFVFVAIGMWFMARLTRVTDASRRGWRALSLVVAVVLLLGVVGLLLGERGAMFVARVPGMMLLLSLWAFGLARFFGGLSNQQQALIRDGGETT